MTATRLCVDQTHELSQLKAEFAAQMVDSDRTSLAGRRAARISANEVEVLFCLQIKCRRDGDVHLAFQTATFHLAS